MTQLQKLKEMRMQPDMSDSDVIRVRSFLLSLIIKRKKHDPAKVINDALTLLNDRHLNAQGLRFAFPFSLTGIVLTREAGIAGDQRTSRVSSKGFKWANARFAGLENAGGCTVP